MVKRISVAAVAIPVLAAIIWLGHWPLAIVLAAAGTLALRELFALAAPSGVRPFAATATVVAVAAPLLACWSTVSPDASAAIHDWWTFALLALVVWIVGLAVFTRAPEARPLAAVSLTLLAMAYVVMLPLSLYYIRHASWPSRSLTGAAVVFLPLVVTWVCDSAAMFGGRMFGGPKLAPRVSPGKTRSGGICGVVGGALVAALYAALVLPHVGITMGVAAGLVFGALLAVVGQVGDLAESLFKREAGVKDSSTLIPGHGGVLDRLDSLYFVLPVALIGYHVLGIV